MTAQGGADSTPAEELPAHECWALVRSSEVGRLAVTVGEDGHPDIFPVNHVVDHGTVVLRTAAGTKLSAAAGRPVAFEVDGVDEVTSAAWSVVVKGRAAVVGRLHDSLDAMGLPLQPWHAAPKPVFLRIVPSSVTGRRFPAPGSASRGQPQPDPE